MRTGAKHRLLRTKALLVFLAAFPGVGLAQEQPRLSEPKRGNIILEKTYQFYVRPYKDRVVFDPNLYKPPRRRPLTPEDVLAIIVLVAQAQGDVEGYLKYLSPEYRQAFQEQLKEGRISKSEIAKQWKSKFAGKVIELTHHVYRGEYEIIRYRVLEKNTEREVELGALAFGRSKRGLELVDLSGDVVFQNLDFQGKTKHIRSQAE